MTILGQFKNGAKVTITAQRGRTVECSIACFHQVTNRVMAISASVGETVKNLVSSAILAQRK